MICTERNAYAHRVTGSTPKALNLWRNAASTLEERERRRLYERGCLAAGWGDTEEQLLRLMVWVSTKLVHDAIRSEQMAPISLLEAGRGWCDQQVWVWCFFAHNWVGVSTHALTLKHTDGTNGHVVGETFYDEAWHLFDVEASHCTVYRGTDGEVLGFRQLQAQPEIVEAERHWWQGLNCVGKEGFYKHDADIFNYEEFGRLQFPW